MKNNKKSIIIGAAFIVVALCITGAYMIVTWEPDDSIKPFSADFVSYDNTPSKGNELWDAMVETGAENVEKIEIIEFSVRSDAIFETLDAKEASKFLKETNLAELDFVRKETPLSIEKYFYFLEITVRKKDQFFKLVIYPNGVVRKVENAEIAFDVAIGENILYASSLVDFEHLLNYLKTNQKKNT